LPKRRQLSEGGLRAYSCPSFNGWPSSNSGAPKQPMYYGHSHRNSFSSSSQKWSEKWNGRNELGLSDLNRAYSRTLLMRGEFLGPKRRLITILLKLLYPVSLSNNQKYLNKQDEPDGLNDYVHSGHL
jgi:hypothetical protein